MIKILLKPWINKELIWNTKREVASIQKSQRTKLSPKWEGRSSSFKKTTWQRRNCLRPSKQLTPLRTRQAVTTSCLAISLLRINRRICNNKLYSRK